MPLPLFLSRPPPGFLAVAVVRGVQLALVGGYRCCCNPRLFQHRYYHQVWVAVQMSLVIQACVWVLRWALRLPATGEFVDAVAEFATGAVRFFRPELDALFMTLLAYMDEVYVRNHPERPTHRFYPPLQEAEVRPPRRSRLAAVVLVVLVPLGIKDPAFADFTARHLKRSAMTATISRVLHIRYVGSPLLGLALFLLLRNVLGSKPAAGAMALVAVLPRRYGLRGVAAFWGGRSTAHALLQPYLLRVPFLAAQRRRWFAAREGVLFGFGVCFYLLMKTPMVGVLVYGFAEASAAFMVTKTTEPWRPLPEWLDAEICWVSK